MIYADIALQMKALSDETRLKIVEMLGNGELCACRILESLSVSQPTLSYHMRILCESGLVSSRRDGSWMRYSLQPLTWEQLHSEIHALCPRTEGTIAVTGYCPVKGDGSN